MLGLERSSTATTGFLAIRLLPTAPERLYYPADGGTVMYVASPDAAGPSPPATSRSPFYGSGYTANRPHTTANTFINTPITSDSSGDIFFGSIAAGWERSGLDERRRRIAANGGHLGPRRLRDVAGGDHPTWASASGSSWLRNAAASPGRCLKRRRSPVPLRIPGRPVRPSGGRASLTMAASLPVCGSLRVTWAVTASV